MPLKARTGPDSEPRTAPPSVQTTSGSTAVQVAAFVCWMDKIDVNRQVAASASAGRISFLREERGCVDEVHGILGVNESNLDSPCGPRSPDSSIVEGTRDIKAISPTGNGA